MVVRFTVTGRTVAELKRAARGNLDRLFMSEESAPGVEDLELGVTAKLVNAHGEVELWEADVEVVV